MKKMFLLAFLVMFAGTVQAQQTMVRSSDQLNVAQGTIDQAPAPSLLPVINEPAGDKARSSKNKLGKTQVKFGQIAVGYMANTYGYIGENRSQIAYDPKTGTTAVIYRGNDRSGDMDGNTLYVRYSTDNGASWSGEGDNISSSSTPRYPSVFLNNNKTQAIWAQQMIYGGGNPGWGEVHTMQSDYGNGNLLYGQFLAPPTWQIPWQIVPDQSTGNIYTMVVALDPANGESFDEIYIIESTDDGATWAMLENPAWTDAMVPNGYFSSNIRFDVSPNGTMMVSMGLIQESEPGRAFLLDENHEVAWWTSTDHGANWSAMQRIHPLVDIPALPSPFETGLLKMTWDFDGILDENDDPHFLVMCSADINPFGIADDLIIIDDTTSLYNLSNVDSTFICEITVQDGEKKLITVGPSRRISTYRLSFAQDDGTANRFTPELKWARNYDGDKIYAKWSTPMQSWHLEVIGEQLTLFADTIHNAYANGRHVDSRSINPYRFPWTYGSPSYEGAEQDSINDVAMRFTENEAVMVKYSKVAYYASDAGQLSTVYVEWGIGENLDDDPVFTDQTVWFVQDMIVDNVIVGVEDTQNLPAEFELSQNYPNPFNPGTTINYSLPVSGNITLRVFNMLGSEVATLVNGVQQAGTHNVHFDASNLPSGMYMYRLESASTSVSKKMILMK